MQFDIHSCQHRYDGCSACDVRTASRKDVARNRDRSHSEISSLGTELPYFSIDNARVIYTKKV